MAMSDAFLNELRDAGIAAITHVGLVDETGTELTGGDPAYARIADAFEADGTGKLKPTADRTFNVPASTTVGGWRAYSASEGGTDWGGEDLTNEVFAEQGEYTLLAASTSVTVSVPG
jgi:hypothetical protein